MKKLDFKPEEIQAVPKLRSKRIAKSATPKYTLDWYLKWISSIIVLCAMSIRGVEGLQLYDLILSVVGIFGWLLVSIMWRDRALIILNSFGLLFLVRNLIETLAG
jgi:hypothetical protein